MQTTELTKSVPITPERWRRYRSDPCAFVEEQCFGLLGDTMQRPELYPLQGRILRHWYKHRPPRSLIVLGKKQAKTATCVWQIEFEICTKRNQLVTMLSTAKTATKMMGYSMLCESFNANPELMKRAGVEIGKNNIYVRATNSTVVPITRVRSASAVGTNWSLCFVDELQQFTEKEHFQVFRENTARSLTRPDAMLIMAAYGAFKGRSLILEREERRARKIRDHRKYLLVARRGFHEDRPPWASDEALLAEREGMATSDWRRIYLAKSVRDERENRHPFSARQVGEITDPHHTRQDVRPPRAERVLVCVDGSVLWDFCVLSAWALCDGVLTLLDMRAEMAGKDSEIDLRRLEADVSTWCRRFGADDICADPYQLKFACQAWQAAGHQVAEWTGMAKPQATSLLVDAVRNRRLRLYENAGVCPDRHGVEWDLQRELRHILLKPGQGGALTVAHEGEGDRPGRSFDDRVTCAMMALWRVHSLGHELGAITAEEAVQWASEQPRFETVATLPLVLSQPRHGRFFPRSRSPFADFLTLGQGAELLVDSAWLESRFGGNWSWGDE